MILWCGGFGGKNAAVVALLLDRGANPNTSSPGWTFLGECGKADERQRERERERVCFDDDE